MTLRRIRHLCAALIAAACLSADARAAPVAKLHVTLTPERLGHSTSLAFRLHVDTAPGELPAAVTELELNYPSSLGLAVGGLGLLSCPVSTLEAFGPNECSSNSRMGHGNALAEIQLGSETFSETAEIAVLRAPEQENHVGMYFFLHAHTPLDSEIVVPGLLLPGAAPSQESLQIKVPLVEAFPEGPYIALIQLDASIGSAGLTYHERVHGHLVSYKPAGILLPNSCPTGGFRFTANLTFITGARTTARARVLCPRSLPRARR